MLVNKVRKFEFPSSNTFEVSQKIDGGGGRGKIDPPRKVGLTLDVLLVDFL